MILYEAFEYTFSSSTDLFPYFFAHDEADASLYKIAKRYKRKHALNEKSSRVCRDKSKTSILKQSLYQDRSHSNNRRQEPLVLGKETGAVNGVKELTDQIEFVFQTKVRRLELMYLRDGQDFTDFKKQSRQYSFACLLGAKREISLHSNGGKKRRVFTLRHGDLLYLNDKTTASYCRGIRRYADASSESVVISFYCDRPFSVEI
eukprot:g1429.t1